MFLFPFMDLSFTYDTSSLKLKPRIKKKKKSPRPQQTPVYMRGNPETIDLILFVVHKRETEFFFRQSLFPRFVVTIRSWPTFRVLKGNYSRIAIHYKSVLVQKSISRDSMIAPVSHHNGFTTFPAHLCFVFFS